MWIEEIYQNIFCGSADGTRKQATGLVAQWGNRYGRKPASDQRDRSGLAQLSAGPMRHVQERRARERHRPRSDAAATIARYARLPAW